MSEKYDLIVIGAGPGGYTAAISAAQQGMKVAITEAFNAGGTCLNRGCIPTKTLLHSSNMFREMKSSEGIGIFAEKLSYDMQAIYHRKDEIVSDIRGNIEALLKANKIDLFHGKAKILSSAEVEVYDEGEMTQLQTAKILIATGAIPARPPIEGLNLSGVITSNELLEGQAIDYKSLIIIGGGVIGLEFASFFNDLGCNVTIIEATDRILPTLDRELSQNLSMILKKRGVTIHTGCTVERISGSDGALCCHFTGKSGSQELSAQGVLVSIGRKPNVEGLFGDGLNVKMQRGIVVDEHFETSEKDIYAIGAVLEGSIQLAHMASAQALNVVAEIAGNKPPVELSVVPSCI
ncbi:MAG: FAD-dependent oxidoreductase, partial [Oscillospiraceae bacterium]|nr:FAD-dependent oxidoreductase [Oscillospiraceae bacterium]